MNYRRLLLIILFSILELCAKAQIFVPETVELPKIPLSLTFAGEEVPLSQHITREWLANELIVTKYMHSRSLKSLLHSTQYFPIIEPILKKNGIPSDFKYLCVAESGLDPAAHSPAKAAGLWQILVKTGRELGLEVNSTVDERYHVEKSTQAACEYLNGAFSNYNNWTMAAASYNVGISGLTRRSGTQKENNFYDLFLPTETMRYIFRILSYKVLFENPLDMDFSVTAENFYSPRKYILIQISDKLIDWIEVAKSNNTTYRAMRDLNNWIREYKHENKSGKIYEVKIPIT